MTNRVFPLPTQNGGCNGFDDDFEDDPGDEESDVEGMQKQIDQLFNYVRFQAIIIIFIWISILMSSIPELLTKLL